MSDIERAKKLLNEGEYTCVLIKGQEVITSRERGVAPLLSLLDGRGSLRGFSAADRTVGAGAAHIYVALGVDTVFARVMSDTARAVLDSAKISHGCDLFVPVIINRRGDGTCPIEAVLSPEDTTVLAIEKIRTRLSELSGK
ncbi:MAG: DUF1893 domain-containing protein [Clostridia bacterium]|nr:DUF1893 domain-containing protein [Clostridia bacterium]